MSGWSHMHTKRMYCNAMRFYAPLDYAVKGD